MTQAWDFVNADILWGVTAGILARPIDSCKFSVRVNHVLKVIADPPVTTISQLVNLTERDLLRLNNFGRRSLNEVKAALAEHGLRLKP